LRLKPRLDGWHGQPGRFPHNLEENRFLLSSYVGINVLVRNEENSNIYPFTFDIIIDENNILVNRDIRNKHLDDRIMNFYLPILKQLL
jgi:hypothetical protein